MKLYNANNSKIMWVSNVINMQDLIDCEEGLGIVQAQYL